MLIISGGICLLGLIVSVKYYKDIVNPVCLFSLFWGMMIFLNSLNLYRLQDVSFRTQVLILLATISFYVGCSGRFSLKTRIEKTPTDNGIYHNGLFICVQICVVLYLVFRSVIVFGLLQAGYEYSYIRIMYNRGEETALGVSAIETMFRMYLIEPFVYANVALFPYLVWNTKPGEGIKKKVPIIFAVVMIALFSFSSGSRIELILVVGLFLIASMTRNKSKSLINSLRNLRFEKIKKRRVLYLVIIAIVAVVYISMGRTSEMQLFKSIYAYFGCSFHFLDYKLTDFLANPTYTYGLNTVMGLIRLPMTFIFNFLLNTDYPELYDYAANVAVDLQQTVNLSSEISLNAYATPIYYLFVDGGYFGVSFGFCLYGYLLKSGYNKMKKTNYSVGSTAVYLLLCVSIYNLLVRWQFYRPQYIFAFLWLHVFCSNMFRRIKFKS